MNLRISRSAISSPQFSISDAVVNEGNNLVFNVELNSELEETSTVEFTTMNVSAMAGTHYISQSGVLTFNPGDTFQTVIVPSIALPEFCGPDRTVNIILSSANGAGIKKAVGIGTIRDADLPSVSVSSASATEGGNLSFNVSLSSACPSKAISFNFSTSAGTASAGVDFTSVNSIFTIAAGMTSTTINVPTINDVLYEGASESLSVNLGSVTNGTLGTSSATGTILENDSVPVVSFSSSSQSVSEGGVSSSFTVNLSNPSVQTVSIPLTLSGTALGSGTDYGTFSSPITIPAGALNATYSISILEDNLVEANETIILNMGTPTNATKTSPDVHTVTILNNDIAKIDNVTSSETNGTFASGTISIQVVFNTSVNVVGTPLLNLNTTPARFASYVSGSGTSTLNFSYALQPGDQSADLDYVSTSALVLSGGTIQDSMNSANANLTLALPGTTGSLGLNKNLVVNAPTIPSISSITLPVDGISYVGEALNFGIVFSEPVIVTGTPTLSLNIGGTSATASYVSGSGSSTLVFRYYVGANITGDGPVLTSPLSLSGGTIKSGANINATLTFSYPSTTGILVDGRSITLSIQGNQYFVLEESNGINQDVTITLSAAALVDHTIPVKGFGTAIGLTDFDFGSSSVFIPAGQTSVTFSFDILDESVDERLEYFDVVIDKPSGKSNLFLGSSYWSHISILDDDPIKHEWLMVDVHDFNFTGHTCGIKMNGVLKCWGANTYGQIGDGTTDSRAYPTTIDPGVSYKYVSVGDETSCAITTTGILKCWGDNASGLLGNGSNSGFATTPQVVDSGVSYLNVSLDDSYVCAITNTGALKCWGRNIYGNLGIGSTVNKYSPTPVTPGITYKKVSIGFSHACAIDSSDQLFCWGLNYNGMIGDGTTTARSSPVLITSGITSVSVSGYHTCAIDSSSRLKCWGGNSGYYLGDGTQVNSLIPKDIDTLTSYQSVGIGDHGSCGTTTSGVLKCWGQDVDGRIGIVEDTHEYEKTTPTTVDAGVSYNSVSTSRHTCGITNTGLLKCWGSNRSGQLGNGISETVSYPRSIDIYTVYDSVTMSSNHSCGLTNTGIARCWGQGYDGAIGDGTDIFRPYPVNVHSSTAFKSITAGYDHSCGITSDDRIKCWGGNYNGELGDGTLDPKMTPIYVDSPTTYKMVTIGESHACGITSADVLKCWGGNYSGQLGDGSLVDSLVPVEIDAGESYRIVKAGSAHTCGITTTNVLKCWGGNTNSELGDGSSTDSTSPVIIDSSVNYKDIFPGSSSTCGITSTDVLKCWGANNQGQVGDGSTTLKASPTEIDSGTSYIKVSPAHDHTCGITSGGVLKCWGNGFSIGLSSSTASNLTPLTIDSGIFYKSIATSYSATCGVTTTGRLKCWGNWQNDNLGYMNHYRFPMPVDTD